MTKKNIKKVKPNIKATKEYRQGIIDGVVKPLYQKAVNIVNRNVSVSKKRQLAIDLLDIDADEELLASNFVARIDSENTNRISGQLKKFIPTDNMAGSPNSLLIQKTLDNVNLIKTLNEKAKLDFSKTIIDTIGTGVDKKNIIDILQKKYKSNKFNATRIASDQSKKLNGIFTAEKHRQLGISEFIWRTVEDEAVRSEHAELDGRKFSYTDPPTIGLPGEAGINCRCIAVPVFPGIND